MLDENEIVWDEPQLTQNEQQMAQPLEQSGIVWDDAQPIAQQEPSMFDRVMKYKRELGETLSENLPHLMAVPQAVTGFAAEAIGAEGSQVAEAMSVKSRLENIDFAYSDLAHTFKSATGDKESEKLLKVKQNKLNDEVVGILSDRGIEAYNDNGKLLVVTKDNEGNDVLNDLDENVLDSVLGGFTSSAGEIGAGIMGAGAGATMAQKALPPTAPLPLRGAAGVTGGLIGGYTGATIGRATDLIRNAVSLNKEIDAKETLSKSLAAGVADVTGAVAVGAIAKGASKVGEKVSKPLGKVWDKVKTLMEQGDIQGAKKQIKLDFDLTDSDIDKLYENVAKDVEYADELTGDDLLRAKLTATMQQQPQGLAPIKEAIKRSSKAAIETSKEIDKRAKEVLNSASQFAKKPSAIKRSIAAYEKSVGKNYGEVRNLIDEALPEYKTDLDLSSFGKTINELSSRVIDPTVKEKTINLAKTLSGKSTKTVGGALVGKQGRETIGDLIDTRQLFNKFYGKNLSHFENANDKKTLLSIQKTIDSKIDDAINTLPENVAKPLKTAFADAKAKYADMFKTQDTATYNAIFKKGASESDIANSLVKYSKSTDKDLETVLSKLSPVQRTKAEFGVINKMVNDNLAKGEAKAIDFAQLSEDIGVSKDIFKSPEAKQFMKNIESFHTKFTKDVELQSAALGITEKTKKNIATSATGKAKMEIATGWFEAFQRLIPKSEKARKLSLQKAIEMSLEKSRTPREFFFKASKIKGLPNKDREALKKAVKDIGNQEKILRNEILSSQKE